MLQAFIGYIFQSCDSRPFNALAAALGAACLTLPVIYPEFSLMLTDDDVLVKDVARAVACM